MADPATCHVRVERLPGRGKCLVADRRAAAGDVLLVESPIAAAQFAWNEACGYLACGQCLQSLETAPDMFCRLAELPAPPQLPYLHCDLVDRATQKPCPGGCGTVYCSDTCRAAAWAQHHRFLCPSGNEGELVSKLRDAWKQFHPPPETTSIELMCRLVVLVATKELSDRKSQNSDPDTAAPDSARDDSVAVSTLTTSVAPEERSSARAAVAATSVDGNQKSGLLDGTPLAGFCYEVELPGGFRHKTLEEGWSAKIDHIRLLMLDLFMRTFPASSAIPVILSEEGFRALLAVIGRNGAGVGTSSIAAYDAKVTELDLQDAEREELDELLNGLYETMEATTGEFLDCEGSALFAMQSCCNHSCVPNAGYSFPLNSTELHLVAIDDIDEGEEVTISYLHPGMVSRCRRVRQEELATNYLFECHCPKCEAQIECPDQSDEESDEDVSEVSDSDGP